MRLALHLAMRFLREGTAQSVLIVLGVTVGMATFVFVSALMSGLQTSLIERTLGSQAHVIVERASPDPRPLLDEKGLVARNVVRVPGAAPAIEEWQKKLAFVRAWRDVQAASPKLVGSVLVRRGNKELGALLIGAETDAFSKIIAMPSAMVSGVYELSSDAVLVGSSLAEDLDLGVGDSIRIGRGAAVTSLRIAGIFSLGNAAADDAWVLTSLRRAQGLLQRPGEVSVIDIRVREPFEADRVASLLSRELDASVSSWMERNEQLLIGLRSQDSSSWMIRLFVLLAVGMGISSVLVVSVVQRSSQIGIMRAIGIGRLRILQVFLLQGLVFGVLGALLGTAIGAVLAQQLAKAALFDVQVHPSLVAVSILVSVGVGIGAAWLPARRAAKLDPATAIRGGAG